MTIETVKLSEIKPYPNNAKKHPQSQIEQIKESILQFGFNDPIAVDENGMIIEGNGRYEALRQLGRASAEIIRLDGLTEQQKKAYILVHNQLTMNTGFDPEILRREIEGIKTIDIGTFDLEIDAELPLSDSEAQTPETDDCLHKFNLVLSESQYQLLMRCSDYVKENVPDERLHKFGNPNKRNDLIFEVVYQWAEQKKLL